MILIWLCPCMSVVMIVFDSIAGEFPFFIEFIFAFRIIYTFINIIILAKKSNCRSIAGFFLVCQCLEVNGTRMRMIASY